MSELAANAAPPAAPRWLDKLPCSPRALQLGAVVLLIVVTLALRPPAALHGAVSKLRHLPYMKGYVPDADPSAAEKADVRAVARCKCLEQSDGNKCNLPLPPPAELQYMGTPGRGQDLCAVPYYRNRHDRQDALRNTSWPYISGDSFRRIADHMYMEELEYECPPVNPDDVKCGDIIMMHTDNTVDFLTDLHPRIKVPYLVISHNADFSVPVTNLSEALDVPGCLLRHWFGSPVPPHNTHPRISEIPIGFANPGWNYGVPEQLVQQYPLSPGEVEARLTAKLEAFIEGTLPAGDVMAVAFGISTNVPERTAAKEAAEAKGFFFQNVDWRAWPSVIEKSLFVLAPRGNVISYETHRVWETLTGGAIPVIRRYYYRPQFHCLPFVVLEDWPDISMEELQRQAVILYKRLRNGEFDFRQVFLDYHLGRIRREQQRVLAECAA